MNDLSNPLSNQEPKKRKIRSSKQKEKDYEAILSDLEAGKNPRVTMLELSLSPAQYNKHLVDAIEAEDFIKPTKVKDAIIRLSSLQPRDRKELIEKLQLDIGIDDAVLLKFERRGDEIICTIIKDAEKPVNAEEGNDPTNIDEEENAHDQGE